MFSLMQFIPALLLASSAPVYVSADWLREHAEDRNLVILHVTDNRTSYDGGHIPGAAVLAWDDFVVNARGLSTEMPDPATLERVFERVGVSDSSIVVVYGEPMLAARAFTALEYIGHSKTHILDGGLQAWRSAGQPVSRERAQIREGMLTARPTDFLINADTVLAMIGRPGISLIDARPPREFSGEDGGMNGRYAAGHIPGARNLYWEQLIQSRADPVLRNEADLRNLFELAGAEPGHTVVVYCMIGMRASVAYAVARQLGYKVMFYDGSWADWSARGLPAER